MILHNARRGLRVRGWLPLALMAVLMVAVGGYAYGKQSAFASQYNLNSLLLSALPLAFVALAQASVLLVGSFDISVGANMGFCSTVLALTVDKVGLPAAIALGIGASGLAGLVNGILVARFRVNPFITTLAMATFLVGLSNQLTSGNSQLISDPGILWLGGLARGQNRRMTMRTGTPHRRARRSCAGAAVGSVRPWRHGTQSTPPAGPAPSNS